MKILNVEVKYSVDQRFFLVTTDSIFYTLLERTMSREWYVPRTENHERYQLKNPEFVDELEREYRDYIERNFNGCL